ncbi:probable 28S ribosomal protein S6, mitochondrial isoform X2 [Cephus cinctus]|uniref:Small ribosomal subunit protein bS6m n=1 Tax=Cephus cinctus TaxID=211228 RepID=A0AAJ7RLE9_CEPCN|nr:probable 28S ribosomal protein S6, mitochondrial isoform X2 [Cephus cinctus]
MFHIKFGIMHNVSYEPEIVSTLKRAATAIFEKGGFIRKIENLGQKDLPAKTSSHGVVSRQAHYFVIYFDVPPKHISNLEDIFNRDIDIVRNRIYKHDLTVNNKPCTLEDELKPPPYRRDVQKLLKITERQESRKKKFSYKSGLNYYPFQK